ncbi:DUF3313 family protein [Pseudomaricurvus sp.]|uniref:DUF3313 family protein n=1 Tax=Pseudomaricurvus sp. TaxID=2004510 RepID=UPI003F6C5AD3
MNLHFSLKGTLVSALLLSVALTGCTTTQAPPVSFDGLNLVPDSKFGTVYLKPGVDLSEYKTVKVESCEVSFRKNWMRDQNSNRLSLNNRVTQKDVDKIKTNLGKACQEHFSKQLASSSKYKVVDAVDTGEPTLLLKPSIINLDINAPDVQTAGISRTYTTSAGEMTLYLEAADSASNAIIARVVDRVRDFDDNYLTWSNSVTNKSDADRVLTRWSKQLAEGLDNMEAATTIQTP